MTPEPQPPAPPPAPDQPRDETAVVAAITAAAEACWPRPAAPPEPEPGGRPSSWRFSGRWWTVPVPARRDRPWATR